VDLWRVAFREFASHPVGGVGADNFDVDYARERRSDTEEPLYPHSLAIRIPSQTGLVGTVLFAGFLVLALASIRSAWRELDPFARAVSASALLSFVYWLVHGSLDWFWEIPALGAPAFAALGLASAVEPEAGARATHSPATSWRKLSLRRAGLVAVSAVAGASLAVPGLAARYAHDARETWRARPAGAIKELDRAARLNYLSDRPSVLAAAIAARVGDRPAMRRELGRALRRTPANWYAHLELALLDASGGRREAALAHLERATRLNPREPSLRLALRGIRSGGRVPAAVLARVETIRTCLLIGPSIDFGLKARCTLEVRT
jgi:tetratricopeptide (TPR) repeat protein